MYFIKTVYNDKQIHFVSKEIEPKSNLPLVKFSTTIDTATKYNNLDVTISRKNNKTKICLECVVIEALNNFIRS